MEKFNFFRYDYYIDSLDITLSLLPRVHKKKIYKGPNFNLDGRRDHRDGDIFIMLSVDSKHRFLTSDFYIHRVIGMKKI